MAANAIEQLNRSRSSALYSSRIIKAGALIGDTKTLLSHWDVNAPVEENTKRVLRDNVFGKASRSRVEDILAIFRQRYLTEDRSRKHSSSCFEKGSRLPLWSDCCISTPLAQTDSLVTSSLNSSANAGTRLGGHQREELRAVPRKWVDEEKTTGHWSNATITRIAQGLLSALRDFGMLQGPSTRRSLLRTFP